MVEQDTPHGAPPGPHEPAPHDVRESNEGIVRVCAVGDVHCGRDSRGALRDLFAKAAKHADVLLLCGDLTNYGLPEEAEVLAGELVPASRMPILGVLGNHDWHSDRQDDLMRVLSEAGVTFLDGEVRVVGGVGFAGVKGFLGGFGSHVLQPWGEHLIKALVHETVEEALKLESALAKLSTPVRIAFMHYSPIEATVAGEPLAIYPFLGSSRLEDPINRYGVTAVFHGHAHRGTPEGQTANGTPVYNVAMPLLRRARPDQPPYRILEIPVGAGKEVE